MAADPALLDEYISSKKRQFLAGLAKGLILSGHSPIPDSCVIFPFYANKFSDAIKKFHAAGGTTPHLEIDHEYLLAEQRGEEFEPDSQLFEQLVNEMASHLHYDFNSEPGDAGLDVHLNFSAVLIGQNALKIPAIEHTLQFLSQKTGASRLIIRSFLADVAYYLGQEDMRKLILNIVRQAVRKNSNPGDHLIVVGHSLGSIVAYDFLASTDDDTVRTRNVDLFVTAGCPLGLEVVKNHLVGKPRLERPKVPAAVPAHRAAWINAYNVRDIVALIQSLSPGFDQSVPGQIRDTRTNNCSDPHAIIDYLADPDVAASIGRAFEGG